MTKKDYELIAYVFFTTNVFNINGDDETGETMRIKLAIRMAEQLALKNNRFDYHKFYVACGLHAKDIPINYPCEKCRGVRDCEARICNNCKPEDKNYLFENPEQTIRRIKNEF